MAILDNQQAPNTTVDGATEYLKNDQYHQYQTVSGLLVVPRCVGAPKVVRQHAEYGTRTVRWDYTRKNRPPVIPAVANTPTGDIFLGSAVVVPLPVPNDQDGGYTFSVAGEYTYLQNVTRDGSDPRQLTNREPGTDALPTGHFPFRMPLQDSLMKLMLEGSTLPAGMTVTNFHNKLGALVGDGGLVDRSILYPWPLTFIPQGAADALIV